MALFQSILTLLLLSVLLLQASRRLHIPYPTMLAVAGVLVAALPWAAAVSFDPGLALALFIAPAILDSAFDFPLRAIRTYWLSLLALAVVAVLVTTAVVAWAGVALGGLPLAAAIVLGAIVSPPDAAAAAAMLNRPDLPHSTATVLKGESLLNDAVALLIFGVALSVATDGGPVAHALPRLALAIPGGLLLGFLSGQLAMFVMRFLIGTLGGILFQFLVTFATWVVAERLGVSPVLAVVAAAMTVAQHDGRMAALDRIHSNAVWVVVVFVLNVLAFLFVGLEARGIVRSLPAAQLHQDLRFAGIVLALVIGVRIVLVMTYNRAVQRLIRHWRGTGGPTLKQGVVAAWCGMRGMVTLAAALALPGGFPQRDLVVLSALAVVLGTLVLQGATLEPLIRFLKFPADDAREREKARVRILLTESAMASLAGRDDAVARQLRVELELELADHRAALRPGRLDGLRVNAIALQRELLRRMRHECQVEDEIYRALEQELDLHELASMRRLQLELIDS
ncbi:MAG TPA: cation:proton antiporter [Steroidobacteraceae bacterium]|nr:cation:proton antiporter [Steroidobacteraceae bacterium]